MGLYAEAVECMFQLAYNGLNVGFFLLLCAFLRLCKNIKRWQYIFMIFSFCVVRLLFFHLFYSFSVVNIIVIGIIDKILNIMLFSIHLLFFLYWFQLFCFVQFMFLMFFLIIFHSFYMLFYAYFYIFGKPHVKIA